MKFLLGMLIGMILMYLITGGLFIAAHLLDYDKFQYDEKDIILFFTVPYQLAIHYYRKIKTKIRYINLKTIIYIPEHHQWYRCKREDYEYFITKYMRNIMKEEYYQELYDRFSYEFDMFYAKPKNKEFKPEWDLPFNNHYVPKSVWKHLGTATKGLGTEDIFLNK